MSTHLSADTYLEVGYPRGKYPLNRQFVKTLVKMVMIESVFEVQFQQVFNFHTSIPYRNTLTTSVSGHIITH